MLAELKGVSEDELAAATTENFFRLFTKVAARPHDSLEVRILGCGSSGGVPRLGGEDGAGYWGACDPDNPKNRRTPLLHPGAAQIRQQAKPACWWIPRPTCASNCWRRASAGWMAC